MRVITGTARGRKLETLQGESVRPTTDMVKESMFSIIQFDVENASVLDMFCGCGQLGIEALSRGAQSAVFVDISRQSMLITEKNLEILVSYVYLCFWSAALHDTVAHLKQ